MRVAMATHFVMICFLRAVPLDQERSSAVYLPEAAGEEPVQLSCGVLLKTWRNGR